MTNNTPNNPYLPQYQFNSLGGGNMNPYALQFPHYSVSGGSMIAIGGHGPGQFAHQQRGTTPFPPPHNEVAYTHQQSQDSGLPSLQGGTVTAGVPFGDQFAHFKWCKMAVGLSSDNPDVVHHHKKDYLQSLHYMLREGAYKGPIKVKSFIDDFGREIQEVRAVMNCQGRQLKSYRAHALREMEAANARAKAFQAEIKSLDEKAIEQERSEKIAEGASIFQCHVDAVLRGHRLDTITYELLKIAAFVTPWQQEAPSPEWFMMRWGKPVEEFNLQEAYDTLKFASDNGCGHEEKFRKNIEKYEHLIHPDFKKTFTSDRIVYAKTYSQEVSEQACLLSVPNTAVFSYLFHFTSRRKSGLFFNSTLTNFLSTR